MVRVRHGGKWWFCGDEDHGSGTRTNLRYVVVLNSGTIKEIQVCHCAMCCYSLGAQCRGGHGCGGSLFYSGSWSCGKERWQNET